MRLQIQDKVPKDEETFFIQGFFCFRKLSGKANVIFSILTMPKGVSQHSLNIKFVKFKGKENHILSREN